MPLPQIVARTNRFVLNPIIRRIAGRIPPFIIIRHVGRSSGKHYETPVMAFRTTAGFVIALTYGPDTDWRHNLEAAGSCTAVYRQRTWLLTQPRLVHGSPRDQLLPRIIRFALTLLQVHHFLFVDAVETATPE